MSVLHNATNVQINGGQFNAFNGRSGSKGLDLIREQSALSALLDSNERYDPPRCDEDTRIALMQEIIAWIDSQEKSASMMLLHGPAGAGKSALEQSIAERCLRAGRLAASFFFSRTALNRSNGNSLIPTLVYQLAQLTPDLRDLVSQAVSQDPSILEMTRKKQMETLCIGPLLDLFNANRPQKRSLWNRLWSLFTPRSKTESKPFPRLIVIDGLDECNDPEIQCDLLRVIAFAIPLLPFPFRFLVASRPESHIMHTFHHDAHLQAIRPRHINLADDPNADADVQTFLLKEFHKIQETHPLRSHLPESWPSKDDIARLVEKASGQFIYVATVMKYIRSLKHRPDDRLEIIIRLSYAPVATPDKPLAQLDALYSHIFSCIDDLGLVLRIFGVLYLSANRADEFELGVEHTTPVRLEEIFRLKSGDIHLVLDDVRSIIDVSDRSLPLRIYHASLFDFLLDSSRSGPFALDLPSVHEALALSYLRNTVSDTRSYRTDAAAYLIWKHVRYVRLSAEIRTCLRSSNLLPFSLQTFYALEPISLNRAPFIRTQWRIMEAVESALDNKALQLDAFFMRDLHHQACSHIQRTLRWGSSVDEFPQAFQLYFSDFVGETEGSTSPPVSVSMTLSKAKFSLLLQLCLEHDKLEPVAVYPKAIMLSSQFWFDNKLEDLARASLLLASTLLPLSTYYDPFVEFLATSEDVAGVFKDATSGECVTLIKPILHYLERCESMIDPSTWVRAQANCAIMRGLSG